MAYFLAARREPAIPFVRATIALSPEVTLITRRDQAGAPAISRDGKNIVFIGEKDGKQSGVLRYFLSQRGSLAGKSCSI